MFCKSRQFASKQNQYVYEKCYKIISSLSIVCFILSRIFLCAIYAIVGPHWHENQQVFHFFCVCVQFLTCISIQAFKCIQLCTCAVVHRSQFSEQNFSVFGAPCADCNFMCYSGNMMNVFDRERIMCLCVCDNWIDFRYTCFNRLIGSLHCSFCLLLLFVCFPLFFCSCCYCCVHIWTLDFLQMGNKKNLRFI